MYWNILDINNEPYPPEGVNVLVSDDLGNEVIAYFLLSGEYRWFRYDEVTDETYDLTFTPTKWKKIMENWRFPFYDIENGIDWEGIENRFDWFREMKDIPQDKIWHAEGDVQVHTKLVCENLIALDEFKVLSEQDKHILVTSALMHDIEKRSTTVEVVIDGEKRIKAPKHAQRGEFTTRQILYKEFDTPFHIREHICKLVKLHGIPLWKDGEKLEREIISAAQCLKVRLLVILSKADVLGRECDDEKKLMDKLEYFEMLAAELSVLDYPRNFESWGHRFKYLSSDSNLGYVPYDDSKFEVHLLCGIAGSGKDTYYRRYLSLKPMISLDDIRREINVKPTDKKGNGRVYQEAKERCKILMRRKESFVFNATNIVTDTRGKWTSLFEAYGGKVTIHYVEVPYNTLINQNHNREHKVPEKVIEKMISNLEIPTFDEAYNIIFV